MLEVDALASVVCPVTASVPPMLVLPLTVRAVADALPKVEVPEMSVENVPVVNDGLGVIAIVLVPEKRMLDPAFRNAIGEL
jgi:hypothetical protein